MAVPSFNELKTWLGKALKNTDWDFNFQKIVDWLTTDYDITADSITAATGTYSGRVTADSFSGDGSLLSNLPTEDASSLDYKITYGKQNSSGYPSFLTAAGSSAAVTLECSTTYTFTATINGTAFTSTNNITLSGLSTAPSSNNTCTCSGTILTSQTYSKTEGEFGNTFIDIASVGSEIVALSGTVAAFKHGSTEYFLGYIEQANATSGRIKNIIRGDTNGTRLTLATNATITLMKANYLFLDVAGTLHFSTYYPEKTGTAPSLQANKYYYNTASGGGWYYTSDGSAYSKTNRLYVGRAYCDATNCVAVQPDDFDRSNWSNQADYSLEYLPTASGSVRINIGKVNVAGRNILGQGHYGYTLPLTTSNINGGAAVATATLYYCYLKNDGSAIWDTICPRAKDYNERGQYIHTQNYWRCIGSIYNDATSQIVNFNHVDNTFSYETNGNAGDDILSGDTTLCDHQGFSTAYVTLGFKSIPPYVIVTDFTHTQTGAYGQITQRKRGNTWGRGIYYMHNQQQGDGFGCNTVPRVFIQNSTVEVKSGAGITGISPYQWTLLY